jgi:hexosaminidase
MATGNQQVLEQLAEHYQQAKSAALAAKTVFVGNVSSVETVVVAEKTVEVADLALTLIAKAQAGEKVREADVNAYQAILSDSAKIYDESIIAIVRPTELLLKQLAE